jgi:hypothetical protein
MKTTVTIASCGAIFTADSTKLPSNSCDYLWDYGVRQSLSDAAAGVTKKSHPNEVERVAEARKRVDTRWAQIVSGAVPGSRTAVDPYAVIAANLGKTVDEVKTMLGVPTTVAEANLLVPTPTESVLIPADKKRKVA